MHIPKITLCVLVAIAVTGCMTTSAQRTYNSAEVTLSNIGSEIKNCNNAVWNSAPELRSTLFIDKSENPQKMRNSKIFIRKADKEIMSALMEKSKAVSRARIYKNSKPS